MDTGVYSINEVRTDDLNLDPFNDKKFDVPQAPSNAGGDEQQGQADQAGGMF
jgi:hypothetical protein